MSRHQKREVEEGGGAGPVFFFWQISGFGEKTLIRKLVFFVCSITLTFSLVKLVKTFFVMSFKIIGLWITKKARMPKLNPLVHFK